MSLLDWQSPLISGLLILALMALGLVIVQLIGRRVLQSVQGMKHLREARRQQLMTLAQIFRWAAEQDNQKSRSEPSVYRLCFSYDPSAHRAPPLPATIPSTSYLGVNKPSQDVYCSRPQPCPTQMVYDGSHEVSSETRLWQRRLSEALTKLTLSKCSVDF